MSAKLIAEIGADTTGFERGLDRAEEAAEKFHHKLSHHLSRAFGVGFLAAASVDLIKQVFERPEKIEETAKKFKLTTDEVQLLEVAAKDAGQTFDEFMGNAQKGAVDLARVLQEMRGKGIEIISEKDIETLAKDKRMVASWGTKLLNTAIGFTGSFLSGSEALGRGDFGEAWREAKRFGYEASNVQYLGYSPWNKPEDTSPARANRESGWMFNLSPATTMRYLLNQKLSGLESQELALQHAGNSHSSFWNPALTDWQQIGAAVSQPSLIITELNETNNLLEDVRKEITTIRADIQLLKGAGF